MFYWGRDIWQVFTLAEIIKRSVQNIWIPKDNFYLTPMLLVPFLFFFCGLTNILETIFINIKKEPFFT